MKPTVIFHNMSFSNSTGRPIDPSHGVSTPAYCPECGPVTVVVPRIVHGISDATLSSSTSQCPKCRNQARIFDAQISFERKVLEKLIVARPTRQQARNFGRLLKKVKSNTDTEVLAQRVSPPLAELTREAAKQSETIQKLTSIWKVAMFVSGLALTTLGGVITADDVWDRYVNEELFEPKKSNETNDVQEDTNKSPKDKGSDMGNEDHPPRRSETNNKPIDV